MARARALGLALLVGVVIFGLALGAVHWLLGTAAFWETIEARWFPAAVIVVNSVSLTVVLIVVEMRRRLSEKRNR